MDETSSIGLDCRQCGTRIAATMTFCGACGTDPSAVTAPALRMRGAIGIYGAALAVTAAALWLSLSVGCWVWLICGVLLNRLVLRRLIEWHPMHNTLANVSRAKIQMALFWSLRYPILFFRLLADRHL